MSIERLLELMPAPDAAYETQGHDWLSVQDALGTDLPSDYKEFLSIYGTGVVGEFLWVLNPFSSNPNLNLEKIRYFQEAYQQMKELFPEEYPRERLPHTGSFLTWAVTDNGDSLFWVLDDSEPNSWCVGIHSSDQGEEELTGLTMSGFLEVLLEKKLESSILPIQFLNIDKDFAPIQT